MPDKNPFDDPNFGSDNPFDDPNFGKPSGVIRRTLGDTGVGLARGIVEVPQALYGVADAVTGGLVDKGSRVIRSAADTAVNAVGDAVTGQHIGRDFGGTGDTATQGMNQTLDKMGEYYSPEAKAASEETHKTADEYAKAGRENYGAVGDIVGGVIGAGVGMAKNPGSILPMVAESLPTMAVPAGVTGKAAEAVFLRSARTALESGASREAASAAGREAVEKFTEGAGGIATAAASEGVMGGGQNAQQAKTEILDMKAADLAKLDSYKALISEGKTPQEAREMLADLAQTHAFIASSLLSTAAGPIAGRFEAKAGARIFGGEAGTGVKMARGARAGLQNTAAEAAQEFVQSAGEQVGQNYGVQQVDPSRSLAEGVGEQAGMGAVAGGVMGAGGHIISGSHAPSAATAETEKPVISGLLPAPGQTSVPQIDGEAGINPIIAGHAADNAQANADAVYAARAQREQELAALAAKGPLSAASAIAIGSGVSQDAQGRRAEAINAGQEQASPLALPAPVTEADKAATQRITEFAGRLPAMPLADAQSIVAMPETEGKYAVIPHPSGSGFTTVPSALLTAQQLEHVSGLQQAGHLPSPEHEMPGAMKAPTGRTPEPTTYGDNERTLGMRNAMADFRKESDTPTPRGAPAPAMTNPAIVPGIPLELNAAKARAEKMTASTGVEHEVVPSPVARDKFSIRPIPQTIDGQSTRVQESAASTQSEQSQGVNNGKQAAGPALSPEARAERLETIAQTWERAGDQVMASRLRAKIGEAPHDSENLVVALDTAKRAEKAAAPSVDDAANEAATSPQNDQTEPTPAQIEAGNYKKGHLTLHGLDISIENPAGSTRTAADGSWSREMVNHYGYIKRTNGADGDHVDTFVGENPESEKAFIVDQVDPKTGKFDEHKVMLGFDSAAEAKAAYHAHYPDDWKGFGAISETTVDGLKAWIKTGNTKTEYAEQPRFDSEATPETSTRAPFQPVSVDMRADTASHAEPSSDPVAEAVTGTPAPQVTNEYGGRALRKKERGVVAAAISNLVNRLNMPAVAFDGMSAIHVRDEKGEGVYHWRPASIGLGEHVLRWVAEGHEGWAQSLRGIIAHEAWHHLDSGKTDFFTTDAPSLEIKRVGEGVRRPIGGIAREAYDAYLNGPKDLQRLLRYPFANMNARSSEMSDAQFTAMLQAEIFAQLGRLFYTNPALLRSTMPLAHSLFTEIHNGLKTASGIDEARAAVQHALRSRDSSGSVAERDAGRGSDRNASLSDHEQDGGQGVGRDAGVLGAAAAGSSGPGLDGRRAGSDQAQRGGDKAGSSPLVGLPADAIGPHQLARDAAAKYMRDAGLTATQPTTYAKVDPKYSAKIADAYEAMKHDPNDPQVKAAYRAMIDETLAQWDAIKKYTGLRVDFASDKRPYPYTVPSDVIRDVRENNHMTVFPTDSGFGGSESAHVDISGNPLLESTGEVISGHKAVANDIFRIVHDYFGHVKEGVGFRANGEENAWRSHSAMYSPLARKAMTSETRGQNSWVNFGPFGEKNRTVSGEDTQYAAQKTGLMPDEFAVDNYEGRPDSLEAREQTDTPQFKKWFGDSKVVDKSGAPRIVYHGTNVDVESFRQPQRHLGATPPTGVFFFAEEAAVSNAFAEDRARLTKEGAANVMPVYLSIRNPADLTSMDAIRAALDAANLDAPRGMTSLQAFALLDNQAVVDALKEDGHDGAFLLERGTPFAAYRNAVDKKANSATLSDFSHMRNFDARVWVAFDPKQIKSAIGNNGDFNAKRPSILEVREGDTVSPRNPSGKKSAEDALAQDLQVGLESLQKDPEAFAHNITIASRYPNFVRSPLRSPEKRAERMIAHMVDNLLWLHDQMPAEIRARSQLWYDGANKIAGRWAKDYGVNRRGVAGVMAVLSPQKDWFMNVSLAQRVLDTVTKQQNTAWSPEMEKTSARIFGKPEQAGLIDAIRGKTLAQLKNLDEKAAWVRIYDEAHNARDYRVIHPEGDEGDFAKNMDGANSRVAWGSTPTIAKAISIFEDQSIENIHRQLGNEHKVRSFYNNIIDPMSAGGHVTIDTHAVAAALLRPLSGNSREVMHNFGSGLKGEGGPKNSIVLGNSGLYGLYAEAYRRAAKERGLLPRQMQSITWEAVRGLFEAKFKAQQKNVDAVNLVWDDFSKGKGTVNDVRNEILRIAGGVTAPEWVSDTRRNEASEGTADAGAVPGVGVAGGGTESNDGGGRASAAAAVPEAGEAGGVTRPDSLEVKEQTMTPEFKAWFRTSKVVDESGQPMVAYHGTNKNISEFKAGRPAWFATNPELANMFAAGGRRKAGEKPGKGSAVYPTFLRIEKPLDLGDRLPGSDMSISGILELAGLPHDKAALESLAKESLESGFVGVASFIENPVEFVAGYYTRKDRLWSVLDNLTLIGALKDAGYDGLKMREAITAGTKKSPLEAQSTTYAVFSPEQIKSAIGNNGNFDSRRPEILEAREYVDAAINAVKDAFTTQKGFGPLKAFQTQYHKAETNAHFKAVYDGVQSYLNDSNRLMNEAADLAPSLLPKLDGLGDVLKRGLSKGDLKAVSAAVFDGTLDDKVFTDAELRTRGLNDKQIGSYREARAVIDQSLTDMYTSEAVKMAKGLVPPSVLRQAKEQSDPWIVVNALANIPTKTDVQKQVYDDLRKSIAKLEDLKREGYAPLQRFGQYTVLVKNANGSTDLFTMHESEREANAFARQVRSQLQPGQTLTQGVMSQEAWKMFQGVSPDTLEIFAEALGASNKEVFQKYLKDAVNNRSTLKRLIRRKKIAGFNDDVQRTLAQFITSNARAAGRNYHWGTVLKAANEATKSAPGDVADEAVTLAKYIEAPQDEAGALRGLLFVNFLGGSVASALVNMTQPILMTFPYLAKFGMAKAAGGLVGAARIAAGGDVSDPVLRAAMERATKEGVIAPHEVAGLYAEAQRNLGGNMTVRRLLRVWGSLFSLAESFNRRITFVAAYRLAQSNGNADPYAFAEKTVAETQGVYNRGNRPNLARGAVGATLFTFKQYSIAYLEFLSRLPVKQKALALALLVMAAGAQGLPFADDIEDVIDTIAQSLGYSFNSKKELRQWAVKTLGEELGGFMTHGVSALPGVPLDIQARLGVSNLIPGTGLLLRSEADKSKEVTEVFGAAGSAAQSLVKAVGAAQEGNYKALATAALPVSVQNALKAMDMAQTGFYRDGKGRRVVDVDAADVAIKAIGFQPSVVARESRKEQDVQQDVGLVKNVGSHISDLWVDGLMEHDQEKVNTARAKLVEWNRTNPDARIIVTPQSIHERLVQAMQTRERRTIKSAPKGIRGEVLTDLRQ